MVTYEIAVDIGCTVKFIDHYLKYDIQLQSYRTSYMAVLGQIKQLQIVILKWATTGFFPTNFKM